MSSAKYRNTKTSTRCLPYCICAVWDMWYTRLRIVNCYIDSKFGRPYIVGDLLLRSTTGQTRAGRQWPARRSMQNGIWDAFLPRHSAWLFWQG